ncbi:LIRP-like [Macrobrachium nipponense]|uniref:LIRP-like n=1 Tax=Macrobrachium nipponense TaxID=159736 RepID=UPI0030C893CB
MRTLNAVLLLTLILQGGVGSPRGSSPSSSSLAQVSGSSSSSSDLGEEEGKPLRRLCGWRLANKLNQVCKGIYNKPTVTNNDLFYRSMRGGGPLYYEFRPKTPEVSDDFRYHFPKTDDSYYYYYYSGGRETDDGGLPPGGYALEGQERSPFLSKQEASQMFKAHPRSKRGLSAECCRKACRVSELMGYCQ